MIKFYLNDKLISGNYNSNQPLLDFIRYNQNLKGTKVGCREGDCGACTVLMGLINPVTNQLEYKTITSCLSPLGAVQNKHIVTIEGINDPIIFVLTPIQQAFVEFGATQCGFCTPGFIMSATCGYLTAPEKANKNLIDYLDGNICRCTGYKSIERACQDLEEKIKPHHNKGLNLSYLVEKKIIPSYFLSIEEKLRNLISNDLLGNQNVDSKTNSVLLGGGTDLMVQKPDEIINSKVIFINNYPLILENDTSIIIDGSSTTEQFFNSEILNNYITNFRNFKKLIASTPIRNLGTIAGNIANASPIGDLSIILLALDASLKLKQREKERVKALKKFFLAYKSLDKQPDEIITSFLIPKQNSSNNRYFNFEKVSKRTNLDIASVNSAIFVEVTKEGKIENILISAGGIAPIPKFLEKTSLFLQHKKIDSQVISLAIEIASREISPISDVRGSKEYKTSLLGKLILAHFITLFPQYVNFEEVYA